MVHSTESDTYVYTLAELILERHQTTALNHPALVSTLGLLNADILQHHKAHLLSMLRTELKYYLPFFKFKTCLK